MLLLLGIFVPWWFTPALNSLISGRMVAKKIGQGTALATAKHEHELLSESVMINTDSLSYKGKGTV